MRGDVGRSARAHHPELEVLARDHASRGVERGHLEDVGTGPQAPAARDLGDRPRARTYGGRPPERAAADGARARGAELGAIRPLAAALAPRADRGVGRRALAGAPRAGAPA